MTRRYWLSFCDPDLPTGRQFLGVTVVEVTDEEAEEVKPEIDALFPRHQPDAEWIAAAARKAWLMGCNPGGEVGTVEITDEATTADLPLYRLLQKDELTRLGVIS